MRIENTTLNTETPMKEGQKEEKAKKKVIPTRKWDTEYLRLLYEEYKRGKNLLELEAESGVPKSTLSKYFRRFRMEEETGLPKELADKLKAAAADERAISISAKAGVMSTLTERVKSEAARRTETYLKIGQVVYEAFLKWAESKGWPVSRIMEADVARIVAEALEKDAMFDRLARENARLKAELNLYRSRVDPVMRMENAMALLGRMLEAAALFKAIFGINFFRTTVGLYYISLLEQYLTGVPSWYLEVM